MGVLPGKETKTIFVFVPKKKHGFYFITYSLIYLSVPIHFYAGVRNNENAQPFQVQK